MLSHMHRILEDDIISYIHSKAIQLFAFKYTPKV